MEGVAGIVKWEQTTGGESLYEEGRKLYTQEINAAVRGAKAAGTTEIVVMDCHGAGKGWTFNSLIPEDLDPPASSSCRTVDGAHGLPRVGLRCRALRRDACARGDGTRRQRTAISGRDPNLWFNGTARR
jgi:hypothetical protein